MKLDLELIQARKRLLLQTLEYSEIDRNHLILVNPYKKLRIISFIKEKIEAKLGSFMKEDLCS